MQGPKTVGFLCVAFVCLAHAAVIDEPSAPAQYEFSYAVNDPTTGDQKDQQESRNGDDVTGYYRTMDSDGFLRTVRYKADAVNGFTAEVLREPVSGAATAAVPVVAKAATVIKPVVAPVPYVASPAPYYFGSAGYPYNYQPYSYNYQPYSYNYQPYSYGYQPYPYNAAYSPYSYSQYGSPIVRRK